MKNNCNTQYKCKNCSAYIKDVSYCVDCDTEACEIVYESDCIVFTGNDLECYGIDENENLTNVLLKLLNFIYGDCKLCVTFKDEDGALSIKTLQPGTSPLKYNGKVWYGDADGLAIYWNSTINKWVCDLDGLGGGSFFQTLDNNNNNLPTSSSTNLWTPACDTSLTKPICSSSLGICPENMCFKFGYITSPAINVNENPQGTLYNGKPWYVINANTYYLYIYWDDDYVAGPAWVVGYSTSSSATLPISNSNIWSYSLIPSDTPNDCISNCPTSNTPWTNTGNEQDDWFFIAVNRGECSVLSCSFSATAVILNPCAEAICGQTYEGYGYLYNWYAIFGANVQTNGGRNYGGIVNTLQPYSDERNQWRVPSDQDWTDLTTYLSGESVAGGKLKTICTSPFMINNGLWGSSNVGATNQVNWAGVPGGSRRLLDGSTFTAINSIGSYWSSNEQDINTARYNNLVGALASVFRDFSGGYKQDGKSLRLVRPATLLEQGLADGTTSNQNPSLPHYIGNSRTYITVKIGNQVWTAQNLIDDQYNNAVSIPEITDDAAWGSSTTGARCSYNNGTITPDQGQIELCGECPQTYLYNHFAISDERELAPPGWRVPTLAEWQTLFNTESDTTYAFIDPLGWLKDDYWGDPSELTNTSGLSLRYNGYRWNNGGFFEDYEGYYWTKDPLTIMALYGCCGDWDNYTAPIVKAKDGYAVRLIKEDDVNPGTVTGNDGRIYPTVKIGNQVWMAADLQETKYRNGDLIPYVADNTDWSNLETGARVTFNNETNCNPTSIPCIEYRFHNNSSIENCVFEYTQCDGTVVEETLLPSSSLIDVCGLWNSVNILSGDIDIEYNGICNP